MFLWWSLLLWLYKCLWIKTELKTTPRSLKTSGSMPIFCFIFVFIIPFLSTLKKGKSGNLFILVNQINEDMFSNAMKKQLSVLLQFYLFYYIHYCYIFKAYTYQTKKDENGVFNIHVNWHLIYTSYFTIITNYILTSTLVWCHSRSDVNVYETIARLWNLLEMFATNIIKVFLCAVGKNFLDSKRNQSMFAFGYFWVAQ